MQVGHILSSPAFHHQYQTPGSSEALFGVQRACPGHKQKRSTGLDSLPYCGTLASRSRSVVVFSVRGGATSPVNSAAMLLESHLGNQPLVCDAYASGPARRINLPSSESRCRRTPVPVGNSSVRDGPSALSKEVGMKARFLRTSFVRASRPSAPVPWGASWRGNKD